MPSGFDIEPLVNYTCLLGEGPVWDAKRKLICWVDILNGEIHEFSPGNKTHHTIHVHQMIGSIALCTNGQYVAALQHGFAFVNRLTGEVNMISDPESHLPNNRFNEGKCDPAGRFWSGTMSLSEDAGAGNVYVLRDKLDHSKVIEGVSISNGLAWTKNSKLLYYIDTPTRSVVAYDFEIESGSISNKRIVISIDANEGYPDGMTIDNEDKLWIAHWDGWRVSRWDPEKGEKLAEITMPVARVTSCTFGGNNYKDLFITSASVGLSDDALQTQPLAGSLFVIRDCGYEGLPAVEFIA
jgi:sugar lactone lactonase YvrE